MRLKRKTWRTGDTCPGCCHDGMKFHAQEQDKTLTGVPYWRGVLSCPACGWFDDLAMAYHYQVPRSARG